MVKRVSFAVKIRPSLKEEVMKLLKQEGLSTCVIMEALLTAWVEGFKVRERSVGLLKSDSKPIVVHNHFTRVVKRGDRRGKVEYRPEPNRYIMPPGLWIYDPDYRG